MANPNKKIWNIIGDGETDEGSIWEALHFISDKKLNIIIIIDRNKISASSKIENKVFFKKIFLKNLISILRLSMDIVISKFLKL